jgi:Cu+-exporting ATPase
MPPVQHPRGQSMTPTTQKTCCCAQATNDSDATKRVAMSIAAGDARDPVCGMVVDAGTAKHRVEHDGQTHYFCCDGCKAKFLADPTRFLKPADKGVPSVPEAPMAPLAAGTIYTCPMHPQIRRNAPGSCPICGMALEPEGVPEAEGSSPELKDMTRRFVIGAVLASPIFVLEMGGHLPVLHLDHYVSMAASMWIQFALATPIVLWCAWPFFQRGWASVLNRSPNMFTLISLGVGASYLYSLLATCAPALFPAGLRQHGGLIPVYYEAAAVVTVLVLLGQVLELRAREKTGGAIRALLKLAPKTARRIRADGTDEEVPLAQVHVGDRLRVRPGEAVPVDGAVTEGASAVDESMVTGESMPVEKSSAAKVIGGTINGTGALVITAEKIGADTMLSRIVQMVAEAQRSRAPIQRGCRLVRSGGHDFGGSGVCGLDDLGTRSRAGSGGGCRRVGAHHCMPVRARARNPNVHHGRRGQRCQRRCPHQKRRSARAVREGRYPGGR